MKVSLPKNIHQSCSAMGCFLENAIFKGPKFWPVNFMSLLEHFSLKVWGCGCYFSSLTSVKYVIIKFDIESQTRARFNFIKGKEKRLYISVAELKLIPLARAGIKTPAIFCISVSLWRIRSAPLKEEHFRILKNWRDCKYF